MTHHLRSIFNRYFMVVIHFRCVKTHYCTAYQIKKPKPGICRLLHIQNGGQALQSSLRHVIYIKDWCYPSKCIHGDCVTTTYGYTCECYPGYNGTHCEININDCISHTCIHGNCVDMVNNFTCSCYIGFGGPTCEGTKINHLYTSYDQKLLQLLIFATII